VTGPGAEADRQRARRLSRLVGAEVERGSLFEDVRTGIDDAHDAEPARDEHRPRRRLDDSARMRALGKVSWLHGGWITLAASLALVALGLYGIHLSGGLDNSSGFLLTSTLVKKQVVFLGVALSACAVAAAVHYKYAAELTWLAAAVTVFLLVFVLIPFVPDALVTPRNGARRWINLGVADFQPSELAKVVFVLVMALYLRRRTTHRELLGLFAPAAIAFVPIALILVEPDLGTALLFVPTLVAMLVAAGARLKHLISTGLLGGGMLVAIVVASLIAAKSGEYPLLRPHQVDRINAVIDQIEGDERHVQGRGFQGHQARMLIGAGGLTGHPDAKARALIEFSRVPEKHNDMIFPVLVNRLGLLGAVGIVGLYAVWVVGALAVAVRCKDPFGRLMVVGLATMVFTQAGINMGMTLGLLPITGMTLPFVSYGGSSLLIAFVMVGLILSVGFRRPPRFWRPSFEFDD
jgi:cell division protein FtsW (lipid II flippase)